MMKPMIAIPIRSTSMTVVPIVLATGVIIIFIIIIITTTTTSTTMAVVVARGRHGGSYLCFVCRR